MAGEGHLEKMGKELKCPICLNLLHSAASLSCNHVFCNSCITTSMKSASFCPVCKVPFHRRDIRPSPHMDSLVTIYKNMEADAGIHHTASDYHEIDGKEEMELSKVPSFPSKKRIHVEPYSISETSPAKDKTPVDQKGEPLFSPFFWMREDVDEDVDQGSEKSTPQPTGDSSSPLVPCFSDIKDENDVSSIGNTPTSKSRAGEILDSEMFEWTQRPCSPELWLTPVKEQIQATGHAEEPCKEEDADESVDKRSLCPTARRKQTFTVQRCTMSKKNACGLKRNLIDEIQDNLVNGRKKKLKGTSSPSGDIIAEMHQGVKCSFCHSSDETQVSGKMVHYLDGKPVPLDINGNTKLIHSHKHCAEWAPNVFFEGEKAINLVDEVSRSRRIKCSHCGVKGAALGCLERTCRKSFHYTCAKLVSGCFWDQEKFVMLCPLHASSKSKTKRVNGKSRQAWRWSNGSSPKWVLCCSSLSTAEKEAVFKLVKLAGASLSKSWNSSVTHVIASVNDNGACKRTLKFLMGIAGGKWILNMDWVNACLKRRGPVPEGPYEITEDVHGVHSGPQRGRLRSLRQEPNLFEGFEFYFWGELSACVKGFLHDLVSAAGGAILRRKPVGKPGKALSPVQVIIVYSFEDGNATSAPAGATALAEATGGRVVTDQWIMDSVAGFSIVL